MWNDFRYGLRQLSKSPGFTLTAIATLALCIGANTAIYSVVDAVLLKPLPYPQPERLAMLVAAWRHGSQSGFHTAQTGEMFEIARDSGAPIEVAAYGGINGVNLYANGRAEFIDQQRVSTGFFHVLGVAPQLGREFERLEDSSGGPAVAVLGYQLWRRVFHGDPDVLGRSINLRGEPYTVVGIMPKDFRTEAPVDVWTPLRPKRTGEGGGWNYGAVARLLPGATWTQVNAQLKAASRRIVNTNMPRDFQVEDRIMPYRLGATDSMRGEILLTWASVLAVLLIGCVNVAGLLMARSAGRRREISIRMALGGSRRAVVRQLLAESVLLALGGGAAGVWLGYYALASLKRLGAQGLALWHPIELDIRVLAAMLGIALLTSILLGLAPAVDSSRIDIRSVLVEGGRGMAGLGRSRLRGALVTLEVALSLVLLVSAGLFVRTLAYLDGLNPGFDPHNVLTAQTSLQDARYRTRDQVERLFREGLERFRHVPRVESAGAALTLPFERPLNDGVNVLDGPAQSQYLVENVYVTPGYLETMHVPVLEGRSFRDSDRPGSPQVAIVSASFARKYFPGESALGHHLGPRKAPLEIVGIVGDVQQKSGISNLGPLSIEPTVYIPVAQTSDAYLVGVHIWFAPKWAVRFQGSEAGLGEELARALSAVDPQLPLVEFRTVDELRERGTQAQRYHAVLFASLAGLAVLLAAVGLYGLIAQTVTQRTRELGIRVALGATIRDAMLSAIAPGLRYTIAGIGIGLLLAFASARYLKHLIWGVQPADPATMVGGAALLLAVASAAALMPALRLLRLDPAQTLRDE